MCGTLLNDENAPADTEVPTGAVVGSVEISR